MTTRQRVRQSLREIVDPCSAATGSDLDIVEMGLLESIDVVGRTVDVRIRLTTPACHMVPYFVEEVERRVGSLPEVESVTVETDDGVEWGPEMMSEEAKQKRERVLDDYASRSERTRER